LFSAKRAMTPIAALSGGERNRVLLAKLFTRAANLLVLDEPTNDLDVETLEALEERLAEYDGTLIVVSHDRHFLDAAVSSTLVFEASGQVVRHAGGYSDWLRRNEALATADAPRGERGGRGEGGERGERGEGGERAEKLKAQPKSAAAPRKLSYKLQRELDGLPDAVERLERDVTVLQEAITASEFYRQPHEHVQRVLADLERAQRELELAMERWAELERQAAALTSD
jgi:ATP-binding cassette subfamily F protein uup